MPLFISLLTLLLPFKIRLERIAKEKEQYQRESSKKRALDQDINEAKGKRPFTIAKVEKSNRKKEATNERATYIASTVR